MSKIINTEKKIEKAVVNGYKAIENGVENGYKKTEDKFVNTFLTPDNDSYETENKSGENTKKVKLNWIGYNKMNRKNEVMI